jgi:hypothetical protein
MTQTRCDAVVLYCPGPEYLLIVLGELVASLGVCPFTLPLLERTAQPETARIEWMELAQWREQKRA